jgi:mono/diheme cytochrome c family protein
LTDIPEHLLARSRERRAAMGSGDGGGGDSGAATPAASGPAGGAVAPVAAAAAPVVVEEAPPRVLRPYVQAAARRPKVPKYAVPVLAFLPVWAFVYFGLLTPKPVSLDPQLAIGRDGFAANCSGCHGANGEGGTGRPLNQVLSVFPNVADHLAWVHVGNKDLAPGTPYGDPAVGRKAHQGYGVMPAFAGALTDDEIAAIVRYERVTFGGEDPATAETAAGAGGEGASQGESAPPAAGNTGGKDASPSSTTSTSTK